MESSGKKTFWVLQGTACAGLQTLGFTLARHHKKETLNHMILADAVRALRRFRETGAKYLLTNVHRGADHLKGAQKVGFLAYAPYDYGLPPFGLRRLAELIEVNRSAIAFAADETSSHNRAPSAPLTTFMIHRNSVAADHPHYPQQSGRRRRVPQSHV